MKKLKLCLLLFLIWRNKQSGGVIMSSAEITLLRFPDNVRLRKEMYLYSPNHCIQEIVDNSVDEFNAGRAKHINVKITDSPGQKFPVVSVADDGGGIPTSKSMF